MSAATDKGVLDALNDLRQLAHQNMTCADSHAFQELRATVAELIEADKEYDAARAAVRAAHGRGRHANLKSAMERIDAAAARRGEALARCNGEGA